MQYAPAKSNVMLSGRKTMSSPFPEGNLEWSAKTWAVLVGGLSAATIAALVNGGLDFGQLLPGIRDSLLTVGAPTCVGILAVSALDPQASSKTLVSSGLAGTFAVASMIAVGALPATVDAQTLALIAICGGGAAVSGWIMGGF